MTLVRPTTPLCLCLLAAAACATSDDPIAPIADDTPTDEPDRSPTMGLPDDPLARRGGPDGSNCAPALPTMVDASGALRPFPSVVSHLYRTLTLERAEVEGEVVLVAELPPPYRDSPSHVGSLGKVIEIFQPPEAIGFARHGYIQGRFGFGWDLGEPGEATCAPLDLNHWRGLGLAVHTALSQAGRCGENRDGTPKYWEVAPLFLLIPGEIYDARRFVSLGLAEWVAEAEPERCIIPARRRGDGLSFEALAIELKDTIPCELAWRHDAVTEGVVELVPSSAEVDDQPLGVRPFTAAGTRPMPGNLASVRKVLRDPWQRAMAAVGWPSLELLAPGDPDSYWVRVAGHAVGPVQAPSELLLPEERAWVEGMVGTYRERCCREVCGATARAVDTGSPPGPPPPPTCTTVCEPEGTCVSGFSTGLITMVSPVTSAECAGDCPHPAEAPPAEAPTCDGPGAPPPEAP